MLNKSESIVEITKALVAVQKAMVPVKKSADNPFFHSKYAPLDKVAPQAMKLLGQNDIAVIQPVTSIDGSSALSTCLLHTSGEYLMSVQPLILDKDNPQGQGAAITYARRYALMSMIGMVADEDDDGNAASHIGPTVSKAHGSATKYATVKQITWMRSMGKEITGLEYGPDIDKWIEEVTGMMPNVVPIGEVGRVVDVLKEQKPEPPTTDLKAPDVAITDDDIAAVERGEIPF
jgi:ERF superfamily